MATGETVPSDAEWGVSIVTRSVGIPFRVYEPRRMHAAELLLSARRWAEREYLVQGARRLTVSAVDQAATDLARRLAGRGVRRGDRVLLHGFSSLDWVISFWAILQLDAVAVLSNAWWTEQETRSAVERTRPRLVLDGLGQQPRFNFGADTVRLSDAFELAADAPLDQFEIDEDKPAVILFTSGTSGQPKGVILAHRSLIAAQHALLQVTRRLPHELPDDWPTDATLQTGPLFHIGGILSIFTAALTGGKLVFPRGRFDATEAIELIERERIRRWSAIPTMLSRVIQRAEDSPRDLGTLTSVVLGGSPVSPDLIARAKAVFPNLDRGVSQIYGMSETGGSLTIASGRDIARRPDVTGRPLPIVELRIDNPDETGVGEVSGRSPAQMIGYLDGDDLGVSSDGWIRTGDVGRIEDGFLYVVGRAKDIVIRGGENVSCTRVEEVLGRHPAVTEVAVVGLPDEDLGEIVAAAVVVRPGGTVDAESLRAYAATRLARFEVPESWLLRSEPLPTNTSDKVDKKAVRTLFDAPGGTA
jgi:acyl-CoA synthetase (AMP-forming)/AMP-acid ligase II